MQSNIYYWWDGIRFVEGQYIKYPHPDRDYYGISPFRSWTTLGDKLLHNQIDHDTSQFLKSVPSGVLCVAIGVLIGTKIAGWVGALIGGIIGVIISSYVGDIVIGQLLDEEGCIWWWISQAFVSWLANNTMYLYRLWFINKRAVYYAILFGFLTYGYLRIGPITFYDAIGIGNPGIPAEPV